jgi:hypothetical protein
MKKAVPSARFFSVATILGLVTASLACLCTGALVAVGYDGFPRILFAGAGFCGYLFFFAHALRALALPAVLIESGSRPDGELRKGTAVQQSKEGASRSALRAAA